MIIDLFDMFHKILTETGCYVFDKQPIFLSKFLPFVDLSAKHWKLS